MSELRFSTVLWWFVFACSCLFMLSGILVLARWHSLLVIDSARKSPPVFINWVFWLTPHPMLLYLASWQPLKLRELRSSCHRRGCGGRARPCGLPSPWLVVAWPVPMHAAFRVECKHKINEVYKVGGRELRELVVILCKYWEDVKQCTSGKDPVVAWLCLWKFRAQPKHKQMSGSTENFSL